MREVDLLIESGDALYPIEINHTVTPTRHACRQFPVTETLRKHQGQGAVICLVDKPLILSDSVTAISVLSL
jgi:hypothetical protein